MMEKVLITGGAGYIGSVLVESLLNKNKYVTVLDNFSYSQMSLLSLVANKNLNIVHGDVRDKSLLKKLVEAHDVIVPLAAIVGMPACERNPDLAAEINFDQIKNISSWLRPTQKLLLPNTNSQYGSSEKIITENSPFKPLSLYAKTKCDAEEVVLSSGNGIVLRLATVFGSSYRVRLDLLVNDFVYKAMTDKLLVLFESSFVRNYIHVRDVASAFMHLIENYSNNNNQAFNVGLSSANLTKLELAYAIKNYIPDLLVIENDFKKDFDQRNYIVSNDKIESTGWKPRYSIEDGIEELVKAYHMIIPNKEYLFTNL